MPGIASAPYDSVDTILNFARVIANDCALSLAGNILADSQPYTFTMLSLAWRKLQDKLDNNAIEALPAEQILQNILATNPLVIADLGSQLYINSNGFFDGDQSYANPALPDDLDTPIKLWERPTGSLGNFTRMIQVLDGLPTRGRTAQLGHWEWREEQIYLIGATQSNDIRMRYKRVLPDFSNDGTEEVPLLRCATALAYLTVEILADGRGSTITKKFSEEKDEAIKQIINKSTRQKQRTNFRRRGYSRRGNRAVW